MVILLTNYNTQKKFLIDANSIISAELDQYGKECTNLYTTVEHFSYKPVVETPEQIANLIVANNSVQSKFILLHKICGNSATQVCLNIDNIAEFYANPMPGMQSLKLPDTLSQENVIDKCPTFIQYKTGNSTNMVDVLESFDYICKMLSSI